MHTFITPEQEQLLRKVMSRLAENLGLTSSQVNHILGKEYSRSERLTQQTFERIGYLMNILQRVDILRQAAESPCISDDPVRDMQTWLNIPQKDLAGKFPLHAMTTNPRHWLPVIYRRVMTGE